MKFLKFKKIVDTEDELFRKRLFIYGGIFLYFTMMYLISKAIWYFQGIYDKVEGGS